MPALGAGTQGHVLTHPATALPRSSQRWPSVPRRSPGPPCLPRLPTGGTQAASRASLHRPWLWCSQGCVERLLPEATGLRPLGLALRSEERVFPRSLGTVAGRQSSREDSPRLHVPSAPTRRLVWGTRSPTRDTSSRPVCPAAAGVTAAEPDPAGRQPSGCDSRAPARSESSSELPWPRRPRAGWPCPSGTPVLCLEIFLCSFFHNFFRFLF